MLDDARRAANKTDPFGEICSFRGEAVRLGQQASISTERCPVLNIQLHVNGFAVRKHPMQSLFSAVLALGLFCGEANNS